jgi:hypothetical protein
VNGLHNQAQNPPAFGGGSYADRPQICTPAWQTQPSAAASQAGSKQGLDYNLPEPDKNPVGSNFECGRAVSSEWAGHCPIAAEINETQSGFVTDTTAHEGPQMAVPMDVEDPHFEGDDLDKKGPAEGKAEAGRGSLVQAIA